MKKEQRIPWSISKSLNHIANYLEILVCFLLIAVIVLTLIDLILDFTNRPLISSQHLFDFDYFFSRTLNLVIAVEFTRMLCRHTPDTIIEVLMFATARNLITEHPTPVGIFLGVLSIGILFTLRKYMLPHTGGAELKWNYTPILRRESRGGEDKSPDTTAPESTEEEAAE